MDRKRFVVALFFSLLFVLPITALSKLLSEEGRTITSSRDETDAIVAKDTVHALLPQTVRGYRLRVRLRRHSTGYTTSNRLFKFRSPLAFSCFRRRTHG